MDFHKFEDKHPQSLLWDIAVENPQIWLTRKHWNSSSCPSLLDGVLPVPRALECCVVGLCQVVCCDWWWKVWADKEMLHCLLLATVTGIRPSGGIPLDHVGLAASYWLLRQLRHSKWSTRGEHMRILMWN